MNKNCVKYKDVYADPSSSLFKALKDGNSKLAEQHYQDAKKKAEKLEGKKDQ